MQEIYRVIARLMGTDLTVLINGESGTGKELVARALHDFGKRRGGPFVAVNMAAIPRELIESELFGHEKGSFTGANARKVGRFEQAEGGTLFLDEIGDMPLEAQTRLLRVLQSGRVHAGRRPPRRSAPTSASSPPPIATCAMLVGQGAVPRGPVLPPQRGAAAPAAAARAGRGHPGRWSSTSWSRRRPRACRSRPSTPEAMVRLKAIAWPGNVRELENLVRRLAVLYAEDTIGEDVIDAELRAGARRRRSPPMPRRSTTISAAPSSAISTAISRAHDGGLPPAGAATTG